MPEFSSTYLAPRAGGLVAIVHQPVHVHFVTGFQGELIQCKTSYSENARLGWEATKDVVAGTAAYEQRHPEVRFKKVCVTNQFFNATAQRHAENNHVELYDQPRLAQLLADHPVRLTEIERFLYTEWNQTGA